MKFLRTFSKSTTQVSAGASATCSMPDSSPAARSSRSGLEGRVPAQNSVKRPPHFASCRPLRRVSGRTRWCASTAAVLLFPLSIYTLYAGDMHGRYHGIHNKSKEAKNQPPRHEIFMGRFEIRPWNQPTKIDMRIWLTEVKHKANSRQLKMGRKGGTLPKERYVASTLSGSSQHRWALPVLSLLGALASMLTMMTGASSLFFLSPSSLCFPSPLLF
ncbi:hypothetical protein BDW67DRAFT_114380 [Aspergillus spinulosporus]